MHQGLFAGYKSMASNPVNGITVNKKAVLSCTLAVAVFIYLVYAWFSTPGKPSTLSNRSSQVIWNQNDFVDIPSSVIQRASKVKIGERTTTVDFEGQKFEIFVREGEVPGTIKVRAGTVLLLHGAGSSSMVWDTLNTLRILAATGYYAAAIDLPGWANSKSSRLKDPTTAGEFLAAFIKAEEIVQPVIVSPSMSGSYAIPYMMNPMPESCDQRLRGFVPVAPVATETFSHAEYHRCEIPTMIVYGTKDKTLGLTSVGNLRNMPRSKITPMEGAGHACIEQRPDDWNRMLYNFLLNIDRH